MPGGDRAVTSRSGGQLYLVDTSVLSRLRNPDVAGLVAGLIRERVAATCDTIEMEVVYSGRSAEHIRLITEQRAKQYLHLPMSATVMNRARKVQVRMGLRGHHRAAGVIDLMTAATAQEYGAVMLHYDADFEHIAATTGQAQLWVAPRGSLD